MKICGDTAFKSSEFLLLNCPLQVARPRSQVNKKQVTFCFVFDLMTSFCWETSKMADGELRDTTWYYQEESQETQWWGAILTNAGTVPNKMTYWWRIIIYVSSQSTKLGCQKTRKITLIKTTVTLRIFLSNFIQTLQNYVFYNDPFENRKTDFVSSTL